MALPGLAEVAGERKLTRMGLPISLDVFPSRMVLNLMFVVVVVLVVSNSLKPPEDGKGGRNNIANILSIVVWPNNGVDMLYL